MLSIYEQKEIPIQRNSGKTYEQLDKNLGHSTACNGTFIRNSHAHGSMRRSGRSKNEKNYQVPKIKAVLCKEPHSWEDLRRKLNLPVTPQTA